ncbi:MAG: HYR domain-containing protein, partial [Flavobacteriia bacterium]
TVGTTVVNWTITDIYGNASTCSTTIIVTDDEQPVIDCPNDITQTADAGVCEALVTVPAMIATDNCAVATIVNDYNNTSDATDVYIVGTTVVNWTVTDVHGNISTCSTTIIVTDNEQPVIGCPNDITHTADAGVCEALVTVPAMIATDNCAVATIVNDYNNTSDATDVYIVGTTVVNWTITDIYGNTSTCSTTIIVTDNEQPVIDCPDDITQTADAGVCEALVTVPAMIATDNCAIATIVNDYNNTSDATDVYIVGTTIVNWTVTDIHGNISTCSTTIIVTDDEQPVIDCPDDITINTDLGSCNATVVSQPMVATDNCAVATIVNSYNNTSDASDSYPVGTTTVTWTVTDIHGNTITCDQLITVLEVELPTITCPADITVFSDLGNCNALINVPAPIANDNCGVASVINDYNNTSDATDVYPVGTTTVTWTVNDNNGNSAQCTMNITVIDNEQPTLDCPNDITQTADAGVCEALVTVPAMIATDNCDIATIVNDYNNTSDATDVYIVGTTVVNWTVTDIHGNISTCSTTIIVTDDEQPVIDCPNDVTQTADAGVCQAAIIVDPMVATDNCAVATIVNDYNNTNNASDVYPVGTTIVNWTVTEIHGNITTCSTTIIVTDDEQPVIDCPNDVTQTADAGVCEAAIIVEPMVATDNCAVATIVNDYNNTDNASD